MSLDGTQMDVMRRQTITARELEGIRKSKGAEQASIMCGGLVTGVVAYMVAHYGTRRVYDYIQQLADNIAEEEISR